MADSDVGVSLKELIEKSYRKKKKISEETAVDRDDIGAWLADMAKRAHQIEVATHILKFTSPLAPRAATNVLKRSFEKREVTEFIGSHCLETMKEDATGNGGASDIYKFLKLEYRGRSLLSLAQDEDLEFLRALSPSLDEARVWCQKFAGIVRENSNAPASDALAKQIYWPTSDGEYRILAPLFSSTLAHEIHTRIHSAKSGNESKSRRKSRKEGHYFEGEIHDYRDILIQKFGGSNPQNVSHLNSERHGQVYLMSSRPPAWRSFPVRLPLKVDSVFSSRVFEWRNQEVLEELKEHLARASKLGKNNMKIREHRDNLIDRILMDLMTYAENLHQKSAAGWSARKDCHLSMAERLWLDPGRSEADVDFARQRENSGRWQNDIARKFAKWLNHHIQVEDNPMGDPEYEEWHRRMLWVLDDRVAESK